MIIEKDQLRRIVEGALLAAGQPLTVARLQSLFEESEAPAKDDLQAALEDIQADCQGRGFELKEVGSGWRFQVREESAPWVNRLWDEKPQKYSRALLETLALIAYRQPITRGDIEEIRGVAVSSHIIKTLTEREWVKAVGHRDVPGRPSLYATTRQFLDYFNLKSLDELPTLSEISDLEKLNPELELGIGESAGEVGAAAPVDPRAAEADLGEGDAATAGDDAEPGEDAVDAVGDDADSGEDAVDAVGDDAGPGEDAVDAVGDDADPGGDAVDTVGDDADPGGDAVDAVGDDAGPGEDAVDAADDALVEDGVAAVEEDAAADTGLVEEGVPDHSESAQGSDQRSEDDRVALADGVDSLSEPEANH